MQRDARGYLTEKQDIERVKHNIAWQLDRKLITRERAMELVEKSGLVGVIGNGLWTRSKSDAEFREMFDPLGPPMSEKELLESLIGLEGMLPPADNPPS